MALTLKPETEQRVQAMVEGGHYSSPEALIEEALDVLEAENPLSIWTPNELNAAIQEGLDSAMREPLVSPEELQQRLNIVLGRR